MSGKNQKFFFAQFLTLWLQKYSIKLTFVFALSFSSGKYFLNISVFLNIRTFFDIKFNIWNSIEWKKNCTQKLFFHTLNLFSLDLNLIFLLTNKVRNIEKNLVSNLETVSFVFPVSESLAFVMKCKKKFKLFFNQSDPQLHN
jgi:hypothetical protein